jgi:hypothetical protein
MIIFGDFESIRFCIDLIIIFVGHNGNVDCGWVGPLILTTGHCIYIYIYIYIYDCRRMV